MKLLEALHLANAEIPAPTGTLSVHLAFSGTTAHLETFLVAELRLARPSLRIDISRGTFGDPVGNLRRLSEARVDVGVAVLEWSDFDPRLGLRRLGGWNRTDQSDILATVAANAKLFAELLVGAAANLPLVVALPTLPLVPVSFAPTWQFDALELEIRELIAKLATRLAEEKRIRLLNAQTLDVLSAPGSRFDVRAELSTGFPYHLDHASALGYLLARGIAPPPLKKGLITDLDDTLWGGLVGEVGSDGVSWDLDHGTQAHGLYQQLLASLADSGVLLAVASKNDARTAASALERKDLRVSRDGFFPLEIHWQPKSQSVSRILKAWNVGPESVVFVDDSPTELAEVRAAHPEIECLLFPRSSPAEMYHLLGQLRDRFGKTEVSAEDAIRLQSLRTTQQFLDADLPQLASSGFLQTLNGCIRLSLQKLPPDERALELVNKTNQFNLNGRRWQDRAWRDRLAQDDVLLLVVGYEDKFGPLGRIAVLSGRSNGTALEVDTWVMSCRAFSRQIEHHCIDFLFNRLRVSAITFDFVETGRNGPVAEFLSQITGEPAKTPTILDRTTYASRCPTLPHRIEEPQ